MFYSLDPDPHENLCGSETLQCRVDIGTFLKNLYNTYIKGTRILILTDVDRVEIFRNFYRYLHIVDIQTEIGKLKVNFQIQLSQYPLLDSW